MTTLSRLTRSTSLRAMSRTAGQFLFWVGLLAAVLTRGAVTPLALNGSAMLIGLSAGLAVLSPPAEPQARRSLHAAMALVALLTAYLLFQSLSFDGNPFANSIWLEAAGLVGPLADDMANAISISPAATHSAVAMLAMPFVVYIAALALFPDDKSALRLLGGLTAIGAGFAFFGLMQVSWLRDSLLFYPKTAYLDSLTGVFVNRNTAGTFLGVASLVGLTLAVSRIRRVHGPRPLSTFFSDARLSGYGGLLFVSAMVLCLLAVFLTKSRGAMFATALAYLFVVPSLTVSRLDRAGQEGQEDKAASTRRLLKRFAVSALVIAAVVAIFGGQAIARMEARGLDVARLCVYAATADMVRDNWLFGTGFGTFDLALPAYRRPDCGTAYDVYLRAHNSFLEGLAGLGILFVPVTLFVYRHVLRNLVLGIRERRRQRHVPLIAIGGVILVTLHALVDFSLQIPGMAAYLAAYLAAATTISLGRRAGAERL
ncbi:MAG: O-antigen ligase family protein [Rhizobiaceae bacterium]|nr:O-antigen ligase family protein [Rhizobiaceae bacterium]